MELAGACDMDTAQEGERAGASESTAATYLRFATIIENAREVGNSS